MMYFLHRFLRLTPIYAFWLFVYWALSPHIGDGPIWFLYDVPGCAQYWVCMASHIHCLKCFATVRDWSVSVV
jgi:hypothetical protein